MARRCWWGAVRLPPSRSVRGLIAGGSVAVKGEPGGCSATLDSDRPHWLGERMNEKETTMSHALPTRPLAVQPKALQAAGLSIRLAARVKAPFKPIADQVIRSASSVPANIAEGHGRFGRDRVYHYRIAYGSAKEVDAHLRLLLDTRSIQSFQAAEALRRFDEVRAMLRPLTHPKPCRSAERPP